MAATSSTPPLDGWRGAGGNASVPWDAWADEIATTALDTSRWSLGYFVCFALAVQVGFEFYRSVVPRLFACAPKLQPRGKHLDVFGPRDKAYIACNMALVQLMAFHYFQFTASAAVPWRLERLSLANSAGALISCFVLYDLFYATLHRALHHRSFYAYVHKHHHRQIVPTRGNSDAINVHPLEFLLGEYVHLLAVWLTARYVVEIHVISCLAFLVLGGTLATLNHTRLDVRLKLPGLGLLLFDVRAHDTHHCAPMSNFGQYTMLWDVLMGTYKDYYAVSGTKRVD